MIDKETERESLYRALAEWKDAGGSIIDVVISLESFIDNRIKEREIEINLCIPRSYFP